MLLSAFPCLNKGHHRKIVYFTDAPERQFCIRSCRRCTRHIPLKISTIKTNQFQCAACSRLHISDIINCLCCSQFTFQEKFQFVKEVHLFVFMVNVDSAYLPSISLYFTYIFYLSATFHS